MRAALYLRVSTTGQTLENQRRVLRQAAKRHGWEIAHEFTDHGVSGSKAREARPAMRALMEGVCRREFDLVAAWDVSRLGRSLTDLLGFLGELNAKGVELYLHQQAIDTTTPAGRALFQVMGVFAEFERAMIRERVAAGLARARAEGRRLGRPPLSREKAKAIAARLKAQNGAGVRRIARELGVGVGSVIRVRDQLGPESAPTG